VLRSVEYGEGGAIVTLLTDGRGKAGVVIRGAKKARSRYTAAAQPYTYGEYIFYRSAGSSSSLGTLHHAAVRDAFPGIRGDPLRGAYAAYLAELTDRVLPDGEPGTGLFPLLKGAYEALSAGKDAAIVCSIAEFGLFGYAGVAPVTDRCAECGRAPEEEAAFWSPEGGGLLCGGCRGRTADAMPLAPAVRALLPRLQRLEPHRLGDVRVRSATRAGIRAALARWSDRHLDLKLRSKAVLEQLEAVLGGGNEPSE